MIICLNVAEEGAVRIKLITQSGVTQEQAGSDPVAALSQVLRCVGRVRVDGFGVVVGEGRFSAVRGAVVAVNAAALVLQRPAIAITPEVWHNNKALLQFLETGISKKRRRTVVFAEGRYHCGPHITTPKKS